MALTKVKINLGTVGSLSGSRARQSDITAVGTLTNFRSTGIDDNADALAITIDSSERVGIGVTDPSNNLEVKGTGATYIRINSNSGTSDSHLLLTVQDSTTQGLDIWHDASHGPTYIDNLIDSSGGDINFRTRVSGTPINAMTIEGDGNVGIGDTSPSNKLVVDAGTTAATAMQVVGYGGYNTLHLIGDGTNTGTAQLLIQATGTGDANLKFHTDALNWNINVDSSATDNPLKFYDYASETTMMTLVSGKVGIGTTSPQAELHVVGAVSGSSTATFSGALNSGAITSTAGITGTTGTFTGNVTVAGTIIASGAADSLMFQVNEYSDSMIIYNSAHRIGFNVGGVVITGATTALSGNLTVGGNLTINGTTTTVSTTNMVVADNMIELNNGASSNANDSGIVIERGSTGDNAIFAWDESADGFIAGTTTATGASTGNLTIAASPLQVAALTATTGTFSGDVSIAPTKKLYFDGAGGDTYIQETQEDYVSFKVNGLTAIRLDEVARVGIGGTSNPFYARVNIPYSGNGSIWCAGSAGGTHSGLEAIHRSSLGGGRPIIGAQGSEPGWEMYHDTTDQEAVMGTRIAGGVSPILKFYYAGGDLVFGTIPDATANGALTPRFTLGEDGNATFAGNVYVGDVLGVNTTSPDSDNNNIHIVSHTSGHDAGITIERSGGGKTQLRHAGGTTEGFTIYNTVEDSPIRFFVNDGGTSASALTISGADKSATFGGTGYFTGNLETAGQFTATDITSFNGTAMTVKRNDGNNTLLLISNTHTGNAEIKLDASDGDFSGSDFAVIAHQNSDKSLHIQTHVSAGNIILHSKGADAVKLDGANATFYGNAHVTNRLVAGNASADPYWTGGLGSAHSYHSFKNYQGTGTAIELVGGATGTAVGMGMIQFINSTNASGTLTDGDAKGIALIMADTYTSLGTNADTGGALKFYTKSPGSGTDSDSSGNQLALTLDHNHNAIFAGNVQFDGNIRQEGDTGAGAYAATFKNTNATRAGGILIDTTFNNSGINEPLLAVRMAGADIFNVSSNKSATIAGKVFIGGYHGFESQSNGWLYVTNNAGTSYTADISRIAGTEFYASSKIYTTMIDPIAGVGGRITLGASGTTFAGAVSVGGNDTVNTDYLEINGSARMYSRNFGLQDPNTQPNLFTASNTFVGIVEVYSEHNSGAGYKRYIYVYGTNGTSFTQDASVQPYGPSQISLNRSGDTIRLSSIAYANYIRVLVTVIKGSITWNN